MLKTIHLVWNKKTNMSDQILILDNITHDLAWDHSLDLTPVEASIEIRRIYLHHVANGIKVLTSVAHDFNKMQKNEMRPIDVMDEEMMVVEVLSR